MACLLVGTFEDHPGTSELLPNDLRAVGLAFARNADLKPARNGGDVVEFKHYSVRRF